jgi:uncharacterized protein (TIGR03083 family)
VGVRHVRHLECLQAEGVALADAAEGVDPDTPVGLVPDWPLRDLLRHIGGIHRWAATTIREARASRYDTTLLAVTGGSWPDDTELVDWYREGHAALVDTIRDADPDLDCWAFLPGRPPRDFWARRQAHETAIHRADAQSCSGAVTPFAVDFAVDGIDELLFGFASRPGDFPAGAPPVLRLRATDADAVWCARLGPERVEATAGEAASGTDADCTVSATASDLYLLLWNRVAPAPAQVAGDPSVLETWRGGVRVRWRE